MNSSKFMVSRQRPYYQDGQPQVEVAKGGLDYAGSDMLCVRYRKLGEGEEFIGLRPAIDAAIAIARQWAKDDDIAVFIATGCTHGLFTELEGEPFTEELATKLQFEADDHDLLLPHCDRCGELIQESFRLIEDEDSRFCSENCASNYAEQEYREREREDQGSEDSDE